MNIESRPEYQASLIQSKADGWSQERLEARDSYRQRIMGFIAGLALPACMTEKPVDIGYDDESVS